MTGLFGPLFSATLPLLAAVGFVIRSRKLPSPGTVLLRLDIAEVDVCDSGRCPAAKEERGVGFVDVCGFGLAVVEDRRDVVVDVDVALGSCLAFEAAVGAVR